MNEKIEHSEIVEQQNLNNLLRIPSRLVIKNIPSELSDEQIKKIFLKDFGNSLKEDMLVIKLEKKYNLKKRNKVLFMTVENFEIRQKVIEFIAKFELVDPKGIKQKLTINDCLLQRKLKTSKDEVIGTIEKCEHFQKFKDFFEKEKILDFKKEEDKCKSNN